MRLSALFSALMLAAVLGLGACGGETTPELPPGPTEWSVSAESTTSEVQVGDDFVYTVTLTHPPDGDFAPPREADFEPFDVLETWAEEISPVETRLHYRLAAYQLPDELEIASLSIRYRDRDGEMATLETEPITVRVVTSLTPDVTDIHDIKDPMALEIPRDWSPLGWLLLALVLSAVAYIIYRKLRSEELEPTAPAWVPPPPPPHEEAETALERLAAKRLIENGEIELFYTELTDIMKRYAGRRFEVPYLERTTEEIVSDLEAKGAPADSLRAILEPADLVKFARHRPHAELARTSLTMAFDLVRETRKDLVEATA